MNQIPLEDSVFADSVHLDNMLSLRIRPASQADSQSASNCVLGDLPNNEAKELQQWTDRVNHIVLPSEQIQRLFKDLYLTVGEQGVRFKDTQSTPLMKALTKATTVQLDVLPSQIRQWSVDNLGNDLFYILRNHLTVRDVLVQGMRRTTSHIHTPNASVIKAMFILLSNLDDMEYPLYTLNGFLTIFMFLEHYLQNSNFRNINVDDSAEKLKNVRIVFSQESEDSDEIHVYMGLVLGTTNKLCMFAFTTDEWKYVGVLDPASPQPVDVAFDIEFDINPFVTALESEPFFPSGENMLKADAYDPDCFVFDGIYAKAAEKREQLPQEWPLGPMGGGRPLPVRGYRGQPADRLRPEGPYLFENLDDNGGDYGGPHCGGATPAVVTPTSAADAATPDAAPPAVTAQLVTAAPDAPPAAMGTAAPPAAMAPLVAVTTQAPPVVTAPPDVVAATLEAEINAIQLPPHIIANYDFVCVGYEEARKQMFGKISDIRRLNEWSENPEIAELPESATLKTLRSQIANLSTQLEIIRKLTILKRESADELVSKIERETATKKAGVDEAVKAIKRVCLERATTELTSLQCDREIFANWVNDIMPH